MTVYSLFLLDSYRVSYPNKQICLVTLSFLVVYSFRGNSKQICWHLLKNIDFVCCRKSRNEKHSKTLTFVALCM